MCECIPRSENTASVTFQHPHIEVHGTCSRVIFLTPVTDLWVGRDDVHGHEGGGLSGPCKLQPMEIGSDVEYSFPKIAREAITNHPTKAFYI